MSELMDMNPDVSYKLPEVSFPAYKRYLAQAEEVAAYINSVELTDENVKQVKKDLADANKIVKALNAKRIEIKKAITEGYKPFEDQIKAIVAPIEAADSVLRTKVRDLEEAEREAKQDRILEIWDHRIWSYSVQVIPNLWENFITPQMLNKSYKMSDVEKDMTDFLETKQREYDTAVSMGNEYQIAFINDPDHSLTNAIQEVNRRAQAEELAAKMNKSDAAAVETKTFVVTGDKDILLVTTWMDSHNINYKII